MMGTYDDSKIRVARKEKPCAHCYKVTIPAGARYLDYKLGQRHSLPVALECAIKTKYTNSEQLRYRCAALAAEAGMNFSASAATSNGG